MLVIAIPSIFAIAFFWLAVDNNKQGNRLLSFLCGVIAFVCLFFAFIQLIQIVA